MAQSALKRWTPGEFLAWQQRQPDRYELVAGCPVRMVAGASNRHDRVVLNLLVALANRLRGSGCTPFTADGGLETIPGQIRRPDAGVDCGRRDPNGYTADDPRLVAEVLSPSTRDLDSIEKVPEYKAVSLRHILLIEPNTAEVVIWTRAAHGAWDRVRVEGLEATVELDAIGVSIPLAVLYEGVEVAATRPGLSLP